MTNLAVAFGDSNTETEATISNHEKKLKEFEKFVQHCGEQMAGGPEALPNFAIGFARAVYEGLIDVAKDKNGDDAAARYFKKLCTFEGKKKYHDRSETSQKSQISKLRQIQNAAACPKFDFVKVLNDAIVDRLAAIKDLGNDAVKSPYPAYVDIAREQLKQDDELDMAQIRAVILKPDNSKEKTLEGQLKKAAKILEDIQTGKDPGVMDQSAEVIQAWENINTRITACMVAKDTEATKAKAIELGLIADDSFGDDDGVIAMPNG